MNVLELFSLKDRVAVVTGASRGLGEGFAVALAEAGAQVVLASRRAADLEPTAEAVRRAGRQALAVEADITREADMARLAAQAVERFGRIDILVNNAATGRCNLPPEETSLEDWRQVIEANVDGAFLCAREVGKVMIRQKAGRILNVASMSGRIINRYFHGGSYDVSKSAVAALTKALAVEWAPHGITVNALAPGYYGTEPNRRFFAERADLHEKVLDLIPLGRLGDMRELAGLVVALVSDCTRYMTGSTILIDGGYTLW